MACFPTSIIDIEDVTLSLGSCTLTITDTNTGDHFFVFRLPTTIALQQGERVLIKDGLTTASISIADLTTLGTTAAAINTAANTCREGTAGA